MYFISVHENDLHSDMLSPRDSLLTIPELYLYFLHHYMDIMSKTLQTVKRNNTFIIGLDQVMSKLRTKLKTGVGNKFFDAKMNAALKHTVDKNKQLYRFSRICFSSLYDRILGWARSHSKEEGSVQRALVMVRRDCVDI